MPVDQQHIRLAWEGRISGCELGKAVELLSLRGGNDALLEYLRRADALPLHDYVPLVEGTLVERFGRASCRDHLERSEPDDDITYTVLALELLEEHGKDLTTDDVGRTWLRRLPGGATFTAERAAYATLLERASSGFPYGAEPRFDLAECSDNPYSDWIGAQIRADLYGWVCPGDATWRRDWRARTRSCHTATTVCTRRFSWRPSGHRFPILNRCQPRSTGR